MKDSIKDPARPLSLARIVFAAGSRKCQNSARVGGSPHKLELLWRRLEDAKLQLDHCHNYIREINQDMLSGVVPFPDGNYAHLHALRTEELAIEGYVRALNDLKAALMLEGPQAL